MTVNHLRYGVLTTYNKTFFVRRCRNDHDTGSVLEVSPVVSLSPSSQSLPLFKAWLYFLDCSRRDHIYTSPYSTPVLSRKLPVTATRFEPEDFSLSSLRFESRSDFDATTSYLLANVSHNVDVKDIVFVKIKNGLASEGNPRQKFLREVLAYSILDGNASIPTFRGCGIASGFLYVIFTDPCGRIITSEEARQHADTIRDAVASLHAAGIVHGDLAHRNVLIQDGRVRVIDFDHARLHARHKGMNGDIDADAFIEQTAWEVAVRDDLDALESLFELESFME
jgi:predicted DNA binding CopG/RHH family protein